MSKNRENGRKGARAEVGLGEDPFLAREQQKYKDPIPSREYILLALKKAKGPVTKAALCKLLKVSKSEKKEAIGHRLLAMVRDRQIIAAGKYFKEITSEDLIAGVITQEKDGTYYLIREDLPAVRLMYSEAHVGLFTGDKVLAYINQLEFSKQLKAVVVEVVEKKEIIFVGKFIQGEDFDYILPLKKNSFQGKLIVCAKSKTKVKAKYGDIVVALLDRDGYEDHKVLAKITKVLGTDYSSGIEVDSAMHAYEIEEAWSASAKQEFAKFTTTVPKRALAGRVDLRDLPLVTIDGEDARDFDDAVYCEAREDGGWRLYVAIADVSYYVKPKTALDEEAKNRGNSTYFPGKVVPMLPEILSNELCSLKPEVDRLCMVCEMDISPKGIVIKSQFYEGVMRSHARLTYTEVSSILEGNDALQKHYAELTEDLFELQNLYDVLHKQRKKRNAIEFELTETRILFTQHGKIDRIIPTARKIAHFIIEECMLCANVAAAQFLHAAKIPALYRVHQEPSNEKFNDLLLFLKGLGVSIKGLNSPSIAYNKLLDRIKDREDAHVIQILMLRSLSQAVYSPQIAGHFGLGYELYTHFTSPIRRYPDLIVHRCIKEALAKKKLNKALKEKRLQDLTGLGEHFSRTERRSDEAVRDVSSSLKCKYMSDKIGQVYKGVISAVTNFGVFVELSDIYVDGLLHIKELDDDYYELELARQRLVGEFSGKVFKLGDELEVVVTSVNVDSRRIDLKLVDGFLGAPIKKRQSYNSSKSGTDNQKRRKVRGKKDKEQEHGRGQGQEENQEIGKGKRKNKHKSKNKNKNKNKKFEISKDGTTNSKRGVKVKSNGSNKSRKSGKLGMESSAVSKKDKIKKIKSNTKKIKRTN